METVNSNLGEDEKNGTANEGPVTYSPLQGTKGETDPKSCWRPRATWAEP